MDLENMDRILLIILSIKVGNISGFIVSDNQMHEGEILQFDNVKFSIEDGVILALGTKAYQEVYPVVKKSLNANQIFTWQ